MGYVTDKSADVYRDFNTAGVPASGPHEPVKSEIRTLFSGVDVAIGAAQAGLTTVATIAARDTFYATEANRGKLVYVNNNNGSPTDPANGVYEYVGSSARLAQSFYAGVALVVQPLVDDAESARDASQGSAVSAAASAASAQSSADSIKLGVDSLKLNLLDRDDLADGAQTQFSSIRTRLYTGTAILASTTSGWSQIAPVYVVNPNVVFLAVMVGDSTATGVPYPRPGVFSAGAPADYTPTSNIAMHTAAGLVTYRPGVEADYFVANGATSTPYGAEIEIAKAFAEERPGQQLVIFKSTRSGSKLSTSGEWLTTGPAGNYVNKSITELVALVASLQAAGKTVIPVLLDIKLGTNDARDSLAEANAVQANLANLIAKFRAQVPILVGVPTMIWRIARNVSVNQYAMQVAAGQEALVAADPTVKLGNGDAIPLDNGDNLHPGYFGVRSEGRVALEMIAGTYAFAEAGPASERIRNGTFDRNLKYYQADNCLWNAGRLQHRKEDEFFEQWFAGLTPGTTYHVGYNYTAVATADQFQIIIYKGEANPVVTFSYLSDAPTGFNFVATHTSNNVRFQRNTRNSDALFDNISVQKVA